jgi:hypothetical protein
MSTISLIIKEAKIVNTEYNKPEKKLDDKTREFKCLNFNIVPTLSVKNPKSPTGWDSKMFAIRCTIWNEKAADCFLKGFDANQKNYISILNGQLNNFHMDEIEKTSSNGKYYTVSAYSYLSATVNDFVITAKAVDGENAYNDKASSEPSGIEDDIPF